jgi:AAA15 family ATPase/GTPase
LKKSQYAHPTGLGYSLLKSLVFYGANASGKTKLFDAMAFMRCVICPPKRDDKVPVFDFWQTKYDSFRLNTYSERQESMFEMVFVLNNIQYRYGLSLDKAKILSEWLYVKKRRETLVFSREGIEVKVNGNQISEKIYSAIKSAGMLSEVIPFISIMATFSDPLSKEIVNWVSNIVVISANDLKPLQLLDPEKKNSIVSFMKAFDINIEDLLPHEIDYEQVPEKIKFLIGDNKPNGKLYDGFYTLHKVYNELYERVDSIKFSLELDESFGTNRLLGMAWHIISSLKNGTLLLIDEFDSGIHSYIILKIVSLFYKSDSTAQLIVNTHNTALLSAKDEDGHSIFKKDNVYVVNKNRYGESSVMPITDYNNDLRSNLEKYYLNGDITGVPYIETESLLNEIEKQ